MSHTSGCCDNLSLIISDFYALIEMLNCPDAGFMITVRLKSSERRWFNVKNIIPHRQSYVAHARSNANVNSLCHHWPQARTGLWLAERSHVTWILASDWSMPVSSHSRTGNERVILSPISHANSQPIIQKYYNDSPTSPILAELTPILGSDWR